MRLIHLGINWSLAGLLPNPETDAFANTFDTVGIRDGGKRTVSRYGTETYGPQAESVAWSPRAGCDPSISLLHIHLVH